MGNSNRKLQLMNRHSEEMENLRNIHDENTRKLEIQKKVNEYNYQQYMAEIERLVQLDKYHYDVEKRKLEAQVRVNDQMQEREKMMVNFTEEKKKIIN